MALAFQRHIVIKIFPMISNYLVRKVLPTKVLEIEVLLIKILPQLPNFFNKDNLVLSSLLEDGS